MKAYTDLAAELGRLSGREGGGRDEYVTKMRGGIKISPGGSRHFSMDHTGRSQIATRKLSKTVSDGSYDQICHLLRQGANPKIADSKGRTPLHFAACRGEAGIVQILISHGASVNEQDNIGNTALHLACTAGHVGVVTTLLKAGTDPMASDSRGSTPLHLALSRLRILNTDSLHKHTPSQRRHEMEKIIDMIREYLRLGVDGGLDDDDDNIEKQGDLIKGQTKKEVQELENLAAKLTLTETPEQVDEVTSLLQTFTELSIHKREIPTSVI